jgi:serine phosphatase RsbU (regulator of sigma subunit)
MTIKKGIFLLRLHRVEFSGIELKPDEKLIALHLNRVGDSIFFSSEKGIFCFNDNSSKIIPFNIFPNDTSSHRLWIYEVYKIDNNQFVITDGEQRNISFYDKKQTKYIKNQTPLLPVSHFNVNAMYYSPESKLLWIGGKNGIIIYKTDLNENYSSTYKTLLRSVTIIDEDSLLNIDNPKRIQLKYNENSLRFEFSAPVFITRGKVLYRYFLKGFDKDTSEWSELTYKDYTNIPNGKYIFTVQSMNQYGKTLEKANFEFEILMPVYRRWWAFIIYAAALYFIIRMYMNWRIKAVEKERKVLEDTVKERTEEIAQSKEEIETQRDELYKQKQEIVDSINYAQRIQHAVLPAEELLQDVLGEHFVYYRPRDIVSGDFYWVKKIKNFSYAVVADCTGHGVPGAFMSMLGSSFLNEIVTTRTLDTAAETLNKLRNKVKRSLHQKGEEGEQKDGMDISLMIIDWDTYDMQFAGAYNSAFVVRKKTVENADDHEPEYELIRLEADRQPIGIYLNEKEFTNRTLKLQKGDAVYALTDGFVDQFGGDTGGKFKSVRLQQMLLSFQDKSPEEQQVIIGRTFNKWKRDIDQVDDVLVMGIMIS